MSFIDRILGKARKQPQAEIHSSMEVFNLFYDADDLSTPQGQAKEGYRNNPYVHRACDLYGVLASIPDPIIQDKEGNDLDNHPLDLLFKRPNRRMSKAKFFTTIGIHMGLYGESFIYPVWTVNGVASLEIADPLYTQVIETGDQWNPVSEYIVNRGTAGVMRIAPEDMIHIRYYNPDKHGARGMSPLESAKRSVEMQNSIRDWNISTTKNGAKTSVVIEVPRALTQEQINRMRNQAENNYSGRSNAGKMLILDDGKKATSIGMTAVEMDFIQGIAVGAREVSVAYGIGSELLGDSQNKTYSNMIEAYKQLVQTTGVPLLQTIYDALTAGILHNPNHPSAYPEVDRITYDPEQINDITIDKAALYTAMESATYLTINEKREKLGYDPINDPMADTPLVNMSLGPLSDVALDDEPQIDDELPYLKGEGTITENIAQMQNDKPKEETITEHLAKLGNE